MTEGNIAKLLISFAIPLLLGNIFQYLYNTVDSLVVGNFVGKEALAAVGSTTYIINTLVMFFGGISVGASVIISRYFGAQVFYAGAESRRLAEKLQTALIQTLDPTSRRLSKPAIGVYLMEHIERPGVLVECGFLSNHQEEARLRDPGYQKKLCSVIAASLSAFALDGQTND